MQMNQILCCPIAAPALAGLTAQAFSMRRRGLAWHDRTRESHMMISMATSYGTS